MASVDMKGLTRFRDAINADSFTLYLISPQMSLGLYRRSLVCDSVPLLVGCGAVYSLTCQPNVRFTQRRWSFTAEISAEMQNQCQD